MEPCARSHSYALEKHINLKKPLKLAFIGGGLNSAVGKVHATASQLDNIWELVCGCFSTNEKVNLETGTIYGVSTHRIHKHWPTLIDKEKNSVDAVAILTPTPSHSEIIIQCLEAGLPVISEKAIALSSSESSIIQNKLKEMHGFLAVTYNYSGYPMVRELGSLIRNGKLGKILHFQVEMPQEGYLRLNACGEKPTPQTWRLSDLSIPTLYLDLGVHTHHLIYYLTQARPLEVLADHQSFGFFDVIDNVSSLCRYSSGIHGQFWFSKSALGHRNGLRIRIYGSEGSAEWFQGNPEELVLAHANGRRSILDRAGNSGVATHDRYNRFKAGHPSGFIEAFANLYADVGSALLQFKKHGKFESDEIFGTNLATEGLFFMESMVRSMVTRKWEKVESII